MITRCVLAVAVCLALSTTAQAGNYSPLTLGFGGGVGYIHAAQPYRSGEMDLVTQINARVKALWMMGLDWSINLTQDPNEVNPTGDALRYAAKTRLTALIYALPMKDFAVYLGTGIGGANIRELVSFTKEGNSYHGGLGFEVNLTKQITLDTSFYVIAPGVKSVERYQQHQLALASVEGGTSALADVPGFTEQEALTELGSRDVGDFISLSNYELMVRVLFFI